MQRTHYADGDTGQYLIIEIGTAHNFGGDAPFGQQYLGGKTDRYRHHGDCEVEKTGHDRAGNGNFVVFAGKRALDKILSEQPVVEIVQIQFNYADYEDSKNQSRACLEVCRKHGKPVIVMEPVRGGALANLPEEAAAIIDGLKGGSQASYAIRFAASFEGVEMVLSGMSNLEQLEENVSFMGDFKPLDETEMAAIWKVCEVFNAQGLIPCTACKYCVDGCPMKINIPGMFYAYNDQKRFRNVKPARYEGLTKDAGKASDCIGCGQCTAVCPQRLVIPDLLDDVAATFEK